MPHFGYLSILKLKDVSTSFHQIVVIHKRNELKKLLFTPFQNPFSSGMIEDEIIDKERGIIHTNKNIRLCVPLGSCTAFVGRRESKEKIIGFLTHFYPLNAIQGIETSQKDLKEALSLEIEDFDIKIFGANIGDHNRSLREQNRNMILEKFPNKQFAHEPRKFSGIYYDIQEGEIIEETYENKNEYRYTLDGKITS